MSSSSLSSYLILLSSNSSVSNLFSICYQRHLSKLFTSLFLLKPPMALLPATNTPHSCSNHSPHSLHPCPHYALHLHHVEFLNYLFICSGYCHVCMEENSFTPVFGKSHNSLRIQLKYSPVKGSFPYSLGRAS